MLSCTLQNVVLALFVIIIMILLYIFVVIVYVKMICKKKRNSYKKTYVSNSTKVRYYYNTIIR